MAVEIRHARTATLVDGPSNPGYDADELQAEDWNAAHPVTADGMGILFANSAGAVAETMTVDMGTLTANTPLTFTQTWDNAAQDVAFKGLRVSVKDRDITESPQGIEAQNAYVQIVRLQGDDTPKDVLEVAESGIRLVGQIDIYSPLGFSGTPAVVLGYNTDGLTVGLPNTVGESYSKYGQFGVTAWQVDEFDDGSVTYYDADEIYTASVSGGTEGSEATLKTSPLHVKFASWAGAPSTSDIPAGYAQVGKDTSTSNVWLAVNDGGTIKKVQLV
jgi:hypothetical protein